MAERPKVSGRAEVEFMVGDCRSDRDAFSQFVSGQYFQRLCGVNNAHARRKRNMSGREDQFWLRASHWNVVGFFQVCSRNVENKARATGADTNRKRAQRKPLN